MKYFLLFITFSLSAKVLIITHSFNRPDFIEIHHKTFKKFLQDDYEYIVFNDAYEHTAEKEQIVATCQKLGIQCIRIPPELHSLNGRFTAGDRHMDNIQYALDKIGYKHDGIVMLIDSDMFLLAPLSVENLMKNCDIAGEIQGRGNSETEIRYISPVLALMNMQRLPNKETISFEGGYIAGFACDVGAHTYYYFKNNPSVRTYFFGAIHIGLLKHHLKCNKCVQMTCPECVKKLKEELKFTDNIIKFIQNCPDNIEFYLNGTFLHYRGGSNWDSKPSQYHIAKTNALNNLLSSLDL